MKNIVLTGFMGTGKTTVGRLLAAATNRAFVDTDELIAQRAGKAVAQIFADEGPGHFRELERELAAELATLQDLVIATGGRMMLDLENARSLGAEGLVLCLQATPDEILDRIAADGVRRPLLEGPDSARRAARLLEERALAYGRYPQVPTGGGKTPSQVAMEIVDSYGLRSLQTPSRPAHCLSVTHPQGTYDVVVGDGLLQRLRELTPDINGAVAVISDSNVSALFARRLNDVSCLAVFEAGEQYKTLETVRDLYEQLLEGGLDRTATVVALGGGVVGDVAGFVAATYMRGVRLVQCPTTLLAMVDASVGGKTGVDLPQGKNLVGAFKQPAAVLADVSALRTLPPAEFAAGMAEVTKHALIAGGELLELLESREWRQERLFQPSDDDLQTLIVEAIKVKRDVVQSDPYETGRRAILNLGHTFAHAIEHVSQYGICHGYAVAMGLVAAVHLSATVGHCDEALQPRVEGLLRRFFLPTRIPGHLDPQDLLSAMSSDKKKARGRLHFVLLRDVGDVFTSADVPAAAILNTLEAMRA